MGPCAWQIKSVSGDLGAVTQSATPGLSHEGLSGLHVSNRRAPPPQPGGAALHSSRQFLGLSRGTGPWEAAANGTGPGGSLAALRGKTMQVEKGLRAKVTETGPLGARGHFTERGPEASSGRPTSPGHTAPCGPSGGPWSTEALNVPSGREAGAAASSRSARRLAACIPTASPLSQDHVQSPQPRPCEAGLGQSRLRPRLPLSSRSLGRGPPHAVPAPRRTEWHGAGAGRPRCLRAGGRALPA